MEKCFLNWSTGKDACMALHLLNQQPDIEVTQLLTTLNKELERVTMHGLHLDLYQKQIEAIGIPAKQIFLDKDIDMQQYQEKMELASLEMKAIGCKKAAFGDILLEDLREYRDEQLGTIGLEGLYPLWKRDTKELAKEIIASGIKAIVVCVNGSVLDKSFCGRIYDEDFIADLPKHVDPCGENGEFHSFCFDAPMFKNPVGFKKLDVVCKEYPAPNNATANIKFYFQNLIAQ